MKKIFVERFISFALADADAAPFLSSNPRGRGSVIALRPCLLPDRFTFFWGQGNSTPLPLWFHRPISLALQDGREIASGPPHFILRVKGHEFFVLRRLGFCRCDGGLIENCI